MSRSGTTDSRDMYAVHALFRREFGELPGLVLGVAAQDQARAQVVASHVALLTDLLHAHHHGEDINCWPKLAARCPEEAESLAGLMESQHLALAAMLETVKRENAEWRQSAEAAARDRLADAAAQVLRPLEEHLDAEEQNMLPLIDRYLTQEEWAEVGNKSLADVPRSKIPVLFGMLLRDASSEHREGLRASVPAPVFATMSRLGPIAYRRYERKLSSP